VQTRTKKEEASLWGGTIVKKSTLHFSFLQGAAAEDASRSTRLLLVGATVTDGYMEEALAASFVLLLVEKCGELTDGWTENNFWLQ